MNINYIKTRKDFENIAIKYNPATITDDQKEKIDEWANELTGQYKGYIDFSEDEPYIRYCRSNTGFNIDSSVDIFDGLEDGEKYTIISLEEFLGEESNVQKIHTANKPVLEQLQELADELNKENPIDWSNLEQWKYEIKYNPTQKRLQCCYDGYKSVKGTPYSTRVEFLDIAIERIGEEKLLTLFGIKKEPKVGQLCWFWSKDIRDGNRCLGILTNIENNKYIDECNDIQWDNCHTLTKAEILAYAEKAEV